LVAGAPKRRQRRRQIGHEIVPKFGNLRFIQKEHDPAAHATPSSENFGGAMHEESQGASASFLINPASFHRGFGEIFVSTAVGSGTLWGRSHPAIETPGSFHHPYFFMSGRCAEARRLFSQLELS